MGLKRKFEKFEKIWSFPRQVIKEIIALNDVREEIFIFPSHTEAAIAGFTKGSIKRAIKLNKKYKGYLWKKRQIQ